MKFRLESGVCGYSNKSVLENINFEVNEGEFLCILGANGVGKSTLFKSILNLIPMIDGMLTINGENINKWKRAEVAKNIGYIPQVSSPPFSYTVMDVVLMGRAAYIGAFDSPSKGDEDIAIAMIEKLGIGKLINKKFLNISGGEQQLVLIARAMTQQPKILIMDEPTSALDFGNQQLVLDQVKTLAEDGLGVILASHNPDQVFLYADKVMMLQDGGIYNIGKPKEIITKESLKDIYGINTKIINTGVKSKFTGEDILSCIPV